MCLVSSRLVSPQAVAALARHPHGRTLIPSRVHQRGKCDEQETKGNRGHGVTAGLSETAASIVG